MVQNIYYNSIIYYKKNICKVSILSLNKHAISLKIYILKVLSLFSEVI
jgi:hypothetical protein